MLKGDQISPWSFYDKNLVQKEIVSQNQAQDVLIYKAKKKKKQKSAKTSFLASISTIEINQSNQKSHRQRTDEKILSQMHRNDDQTDHETLQNNSARNMKQKLYRNRKVSSKSEMVLKIAKFTHLQIGRELQEQHDKVRDLSRHNLILKLIKKKLNQEINPIYDNILNSEHGSSKNQMGKNQYKMTSQLIEKERIFSQKCKLQYIESLHNPDLSYEPLSMRKHQGSNNNAKKHHRQKSNLLQSKNNRFDKIHLINQLHKLQELNLQSTITKNYQNFSLQKESKTCEHKLSRPTFKNNGILLQKYTTLNPDKHYSH